KPIQASKGKRIKTSAKGDKPATKSKGLTVLSEVALSEADQMKLATKRSMKEFQSSHASGSGNGVDIQSKVPNEQQHTVSGTNEGAGDKLEAPDVPEYRSKSEEESWTFSQGEDDEENDEHDSEDDNDEHDSENNNDDEDDDQENESGETESDDDGDNFVHPNLSTYKADDQEKEKEEEKANDDDEVSSNQMVSTPHDYEILDEEEIQEDDDNTPSSDTTIPQPPIPIIQSQQQTHDSTTTTTIPTTTLPEIPNFASLFGFELRVSSLDTELFELKQTNQFAKALSSILSIVDNYLTSKIKEVVDVASYLKSDKLREEAQAENQDFLNSLDSDMKRIIKEQISFPHIVMLLQFQEDTMIKTRMKNPPLDQTEGHREGDQARKLSHPKNQLTRREGQQVLQKRPSRSQPTELEDPFFKTFNTGVD
ncbi:hypothetical protein Tco_1320633, partial [Tanacetum coccineum]